MSLLARINRLEREMPPPPEPDECPECAGRWLWVVGDEADKPGWRLLCPACGRPPRHPRKVLYLGPGAAEAL